jgi:hypothetical protein
VTDRQEPRIRIQLKIYEIFFSNQVILHFLLSFWHPNLRQINSNIPCDVIHLHLLILATL